MPADTDTFWEWYGTRLVWNTIGNDYCPFCDGELIAGNLFFIHLALGFAIGYGVHTLTNSLLASGVPVLVMAYVGGKAFDGFLNHLYGWQDETQEAVAEVADEVQEG